MHYTMHLEGGPRRVNHAAARVGDVIYSFGGYCTGDDYPYQQPIDVHALNVNTMRWSLVPFNKNADGHLLKYPDVPYHRYGHTAVVYQDKIYLWGGRNDETLCNQLFCFDPKTLQWTRLRVSGTVPAARDGHTACVAGDYMYVFGGFIDEMNEFSCDVYCLNFTNMDWRFMHTFGEKPSFRDFHATVPHENRMYIFGGRGDTHSPYHSQEEIYCPQIYYLDLKTRFWHCPKTTGKVPVGRRSHSMFVYNNLIYIFGGYNGLLKLHFNDLYSFDTKTNCWNLLKPHGKIPTVRRRQQCIIKDSLMFMFGGTSPLPYGNDDQTKLIDNSDLYVLDFEPSLKTLAMLAVTENHLDTSFLPKELKWDIRTSTQPNTLSKAINPAG